MCYILNMDKESMQCFKKASWQEKKSYDELLSAVSLLLLYYFTIYWVDGPWLN